MTGVSPAAHQARLAAERRQDDFAEILPGGTRLASPSSVSIRLANGGAQSEGTTDITSGPVNVREKRANATARRPSYSAPVQGVMTLPLLKQR